MKTYIGRREAITADRWHWKHGWSKEEAEKLAAEDPQQTEARIFVRPDNGEEYELPHHVYHSPGGLEWSYGGSGPSEAARCILIDHFGYDSRERGLLVTPEGEETWVLPVSYRSFKSKYLVPAPVEGFTITTVEIEDFIQEQKRVAT